VVATTGSLDALGLDAARRIGRWPPPAADEVGAAGRQSLAAGGLDAAASTLNLVEHGVDPARGVRCCPSVCRAMRRRPRYCRDITVSDGAISRLGLELARGAARLLPWRSSGCAGHDITAISP